MSLVLVLKNKQVISDPYADPYGDSTGWTRQFVTDCDLRVFLEKGQKSLEPQLKIRISAAHNPEVVGSSPASATKKVLKSKDFRTFSCALWTEKSREIFCKSAETLLTHILTHNRIALSGQVRIFQNTMSTKLENLRKAQNF